MLKQIVCWLGLVSASLRDSIEVIEISNTTKDYNALLWKESALNILCNFNATVIYFFFERKASASLATGILRGVNDCGTAVLTLKNKDGYKVEIVNDNGILMYMVLVIANGRHPIRLAHVKKQSGEKSKSFFIVLVENSSDLNEEWLKISFRKFWSLWILNAVIIFWRDDLQIYTYSPFSTGFLKKLKPTARHKNELFTQELPNLNGYPLRVAMHPEEVRAIFNERGDPIRGADVSMMNIVMERLNATKVIVLPENLKPGKIFLNGTGDGSIGLVMRNEADVTFNARFLVPYLFGNVLENSVVIARDDLCVLVPRSGRASPLMNILKPFQSKVWIMIFSVLLGVFVLLQILVPHERNLFLWLTGWSLNMPLSRYPNTDLFRIFLIFWLVYSMLITGSYKGKLTSHLVVPALRPEVNSLPELLKLSYKILMNERHESHLTKYRNTSFHRRMTSLVSLVPSAYFRSHLESNNISFGYMDKWHLQFHRVNSKKHMYNGRPVFHLAKTCPVPFQIVYIVPHGSPFLGFINKITRFSDETGLLLHWSDHVETRKKLTNKRLAKKANREKPRIIKLYNIQSAFFLLFGGWGIAAVVFLMEKYCLKLKEKLLESASFVRAPQESRFDNIEFTN